MQPANPNGFSEYESDTRSAILMLARDGSAYTIMTGNHILNEKIEKFRTRLDKINAMSKEELKVYYQDILNNEGFSQKGGGGLGMVDIARKSGHKLVYQFQPVSEQHSFFSLNIRIGITPNSND